MGALCSSAEHGRTTCFTGPSSSRRRQYSPVGYCGPSTHRPPSFMRTTMVRMVAETLAKVSSCSSAQASRPNSYRYVARAESGGVSGGKKERPAAGAVAARSGS
eukprot:scaffold100581_cov31-Tisochrysis_lutea.AAC.1